MAVQKIGMECQILQWVGETDALPTWSAPFTYVLIPEGLLGAVVPRLNEARWEAAMVGVVHIDSSHSFAEAFNLGADEVLSANELRRLPRVLLSARRNALQRLRFGELRRAHRQLDERFNDMLQLSSDWLWEQDEQLRFSFAAVLAKSDIDIEHVIGRTRWEVAGGDPQSSPWCEHQAVLERHESFKDFVYCNVLSSGRTGWFRISGKPLFNRDGTFKGYRGTARDITEEYLQGNELRESQERFYYAVRGSSAGIWDWKVPEDQYYMSARFKEILGYADEELPNHRSSFMSSLHPDDVSVVQSAVREHFEQRTAYDVQYRMIRKDGATIWCRAIGQAVWDGNGTVLRFAGSTSDITAQREAEIRVASLLRQQDAILENAPVGIAFVKRGRLVRFNQTLSDKLGIRREELLSSGSKQGKAQALGDMQALIAAVSTSTEVLTGELKVHGREGQGLWIQYRSSPLDRQNIGQGHVLVTLDITERKRAEQKLLHLAQHDALTDLPNRVLYRNILVQALSQARRRDWQVGVLFLDLDRFKHINDSLGHSAGDRLLRTVAKRVRGGLRASDTVARLSGDEFGVILPDLQNPDDAVCAAKKIINSLTGPLQLGRREVALSVSVGIAIFPRDGADPDTLIANADAAMYQAKALGRAQYQFFTPELNIRAARFFELETKRGCPVAC